MRHAAALALALALLAGWGAQAAPFGDPTRPPGAGAQAEAGGGDTALGPRLQSVLIAPNRRVAVIDGQAVPLGGHYGDGRVIRITENEVVLQAGEERRTLKLFPDVDKRSARGRGPAAAPRKKE
jgi:MSHA biogenesis protein MshK